MPGGTQMNGLILPFDGISPTIHPEAFVAPNATIIGQVTLGKGSSLWFGVVARGDINTITIGTDSNIQDGTVIHVGRLRHPTVIGDRVTVGHNCIIHGCTLEDDAFVGMGATVLDGAVVESGGMVAAGALVTPNKRVRAGELWMGNPARMMRELTDAEKSSFGETWSRYAERAQIYRTIIAQQASL